MCVYVFCVCLAVTKVIELAQYVQHVQGALICEKKTNLCLRREVRIFVPRHALSKESRIEQKVDDE